MKDLIRLLLLLIAVCSLHAIKMKHASAEYPAAKKNTAEMVPGNKSTVFAIPVNYRTSN